MACNKSVWDEDHVADRKIIVKEPLLKWVMREMPPLCVVRRLYAIHYSIAPLGKKG